MRGHAEAPSVATRVEREAASRSASRSCSNASRASSPAASGSASRWAARSCASRRSFLMDEPLSNLDAQARASQMRTEIARIQQRPRGDDDLRHARPGRGDDDGRPRRGHAGRRAAAVRHARATSTRIRPTLFVASFIGQPAMNLVEALDRADDGGLTVPERAGQALALTGRSRRRRRPALTAVCRVATCGSGDPARRTLAGRSSCRRGLTLSGRSVDLRRSLGFETHCLISRRCIAGQPLRTEDLRMLTPSPVVDRAVQTGGDSEAGAPGRCASTLPARLHARAMRSFLSCDAAALDFFDLETGASIV